MELPSTPEVMQRSSVASCRWFFSDCSRYFPNNNKTKWTEKRFYFNPLNYVCTYY